MKILITGVAGLLGSRLADWILENTDNEIVGIDDLSGGYKSNLSYILNKTSKFYHFNLSTNRIVSGSSSDNRYGKYDLNWIFNKEKPDIVYHFAAYAAEALSPFIRMYNYSNNVVATANVINECVRYNVKRLVFTSSMGVYGHGDNKPPFHEDLVPCPIDPYGIAKYACEMDIKVAGNQHDLDWCIVRPHNVYGEKQNIWDKYRNVLGIWMYQYLNGQDLTIFGDGEQKRAFSYIGDSLLPFWKAGTDERASNQIINLGGTKDYSINEAADTLVQIMGGGNKVFLEQRLEVKYAFPTYEKSLDLLDYEDKTSLEDGLFEMWKWAKQQPKRKRMEWDNFEIEKGLYNYWRTK